MLMNGDSAKQIKQYNLIPIKALISILIKTMESTTTASAVEAGTGDITTCVYIGIKVRPGAVERHRLDNFPLNSTVIALKQQAESRANVPSDSLEAIYHGRILKDDATLAGSGVQAGDMVHVFKKKAPPSQEPPQTFSDAELHQIVSSLRAFGCTPNAPGWTRAMQVLDDESRMEEIMSAVPSLSEDCVSLSMLHEIELLAAMGATLTTMRRGAAALPALPAALRHLTRIVRAQPADTRSDTDSVPTSGFAYSLEALSEDEDGDEDDEDAGRMPSITQEQLAAALREAQDNITTPAGNMSLLQLLRGAGVGGESTGGANSAPDSGRAPATPVPTAGGSRGLISSDMFSNAVAEALSRADFTNTSADTPMDQSTTASSSQSPGPGADSEDYSSQLQHMNSMGLLDNAVNLRALFICAGDVNAAINFIFTSMEE